MRFLVSVILNRTAARIIWGVPKTAALTFPSASAVLKTPIRALLFKKLIISIGVIFISPVQA
jgi:hypothetical protein